ncbi:hypothetical protein ACKFC9_001658 [Campylobacter jejuni]|nr:hypothetical protein [Campylobacter coli]
MSDKELEIFELCHKLAELLGDKEAIADLKKLYTNHPEMFKDMTEVSHTINEVVNNPDLIIKNPRAIVEKDFIAAKKTLSDRETKMGDVGIRNDSGTNVIYHANISSKRNFERLAKKKRVAVGEAVLSLHTSRPAELGGNNQRLSGANAHSTTTDKGIIPKTPIDFQAKLKEFTQKQAQDKNQSKDKERGR